jgi:ribose transport system substrate-binding protein
MPEGGPKVAIRQRSAWLVGGTVLTLILLVVATIDASALPARSSNNPRAQQRLAKLYASTYTRPPLKATTPPRDITVFYIGAGLGAAAISEAGKAFAEAGRRLGWKVVVVDGKFEPNTQLTALNQAIAARADAIVLYGIDCPTVTSGLTKAKRSGIPVIAEESVDCNAGGYRGQKLFAAEVTYREGPFLRWIIKYGEAQGTWLAAKAPGGHGRIIEFVETDILSVKLCAEGFKRAYKTLCPTCKIVSRVPFVGAGFGTLQQKATAALLAHPEANQLYANYDSPVTAGIAAAVQASHRKIQVMGGAGYAPNVTLVRNERGQSAGVGFAAGWEGFAAADVVIRVLNREPVLSSGIGIQVWDAQHNLPPAGKEYTPPIAYRSAYYKAWGVR